MSASERSAQYGLVLRKQLEETYQTLPIPPVDSSDVTYPLGLQGNKRNGFGLGRHAVLFASERHKLIAFERCIQSRAGRLAPYRFNKKVPIEQTQA
jgi:hypothetical protein